MAEPLPDDIVRLLRERVASLEGLEVLLLLRRERSHAMRFDEIAALLSIPASSIEPAIADLTDHGLIVCESATCRYEPGSAEPLIDRMAAIYDDRRLEVMRLLSAHAMERIRNSAARAFADAFVIGRKKNV